MSRIENRKLPAWLGSILFHALLLLLVLFWFSLTPEPNGAPGERNAIGTILLQASGGIRQQADTQTTESEQTAAELEAALTGAGVNALPSIPALAPGPQQNAASSGGAAATDLTQAFQLTNPGPPGVGQGETTVKVFGTNGKGTKFMYVFDCSLSMEGRRLQMAKAELIRSLDALGDLHQFNILFYSGERQHYFWRSGGRLIFAQETEKRAAIRFVEGIIAEGGTHHYQPLLEAIKLRPDVIFFLTDGEKKDDPTAVQLADIERANSRFGAGTQINVIQFGGGGLTDSESRVLRQLADQNHGEYIYVNVR